MGFRVYLGGTSVEGHIKAVPLPLDKNKPIWVRLCCAEIIDLGTPQEVWVYGWSGVPTHNHREWYQFDEFARSDQIRLLQTGENDRVIQYFASKIPDFSSLRG